MSRPDAIDPAVEARVRASFARQTMPATLGATMVEVHPGRVVLQMPPMHGSLSSSVTPPAR